MSRGRRMSRTESVLGVHLAGGAPARWPRRFCGNVPTWSCPLFWPDPQTQRCWPPLLCSGRNWSQTQGLWMDHQSLPRAWENKVKKQNRFNVVWQTRFKWGKIINPLTVEFYPQLLVEPFQHWCHALLKSVKEKWARTFREMRQTSKNKNQLTNTPTYTNALFTWNIKRLLNLWLHSLGISIF